MTNIILGSVPKSIKDICGTNGIFHIRWNKKDRRLYITQKYSDGSESQILNPNYGKYTIPRTGNFRLGVVKNLKGGKRTTDPNEFLIAYDMSKKEYRNIYYNTIQKIVANKKSYFVKVVDTKNIRFGLIERVDNDKR